MTGPIINKDESAIIMSDFPLDDRDLVYPIQYQHAWRSNAPSILFESKILAEREGGKEKAIQEKYDEVILSAEYQANPRDYVQRLIEQRGGNDNWRPVDGVIKRLKTELGVLS